MFNDNKGAYWLSEIEEIRNPYFGEKMLSCGETIESLNF
jgi:Cu(I)/Ag(I) efflux system membrane fusion protein